MKLSKDGFPYWVMATAQRFESVPVNELTLEHLIEVQKTILKNPKHRKRNILPYVDKLIYVRQDIKSQMDLDKKMKENPEEYAGPVCC